MKAIKTVLMILPLFWSLKGQAQDFGSGQGLNTIGGVGLALHMANGDSAPPPDEPVLKTQNVKGDLIFSKCWLSPGVDPKPENFKNCVQFASLSAEKIAAFENVADQSCEHLWDANDASLDAAVILLSLPAGLFGILALDSRVLGVTMPQRTATVVGLAGVALTVYAGYLWIKQVPPLSCRHSIAEILKLRFAKMNEHVPPDYTTYRHISSVFWQLLDQFQTPVPQ